VITLEDICRSFQVGDEAVHALDHITLEIARGEYVSIMGASGSGKSTLLNMIGLLDRPDSGSYRFNGQELTTLSEESRAVFRRENIGVILQSFHLITRLTAAGNLELPLMLQGVPPSERRARARHIRENLGMGDRVDHLPRELSGGQQQRVAIARAMILEPPLLLADEPTGNLDSRSGREVTALLESLHDRGMTLIMVTHDAQLGKRAERQIVMRDGCILQDQHGERAT